MLLGPAAVPCLERCGVQQLAAVRGLYTSRHSEDCRCWRHTCWGSQTGAACVGQVRKEGRKEGRTDWRTDVRKEGQQTMRRVLLTTCRGDHLVQEFGAGALPDLLDDSTQLLVGLVNVALRLDFEGGAHQREEGGIEHHCAVTVQGHVHAHQTLNRKQSNVSYTAVL